MSDKAKFPSPSALSAAAWALNVEVWKIEVFAKVESSSDGAYYDDGQPTLLYERHLFHRFTNGKFNLSKVSNIPHPYNILSSPNPGDYGNKSWQHLKLRAAIKLDRDAALRSCSWGLFQILGDNWKRCGYLSLQDYINDVYQGGADSHLRAFTFFIHSDSDLHRALKDGNWHTVGRLYNGRNYMQTGWYDKAMKAIAAITV
jgi:hypothetical protein